MQDGKIFQTWFQEDSTDIRLSLSDTYLNANVDLSNCIPINNIVPYIQFDEETNHVILEYPTTLDKCVFIMEPSSR